MQKAVAHFAPSDTRATEILDEVGSRSDGDGHALEPYNSAAVPAGNNGFNFEFSHTVEANWV